jgi:predicted TIM-barrel fold metal-dependent hydrolase
MTIDSHLHVWRAQPPQSTPSTTIVPPQCDIPCELIDAYMTEHRVDRAVLAQPVLAGVDNSYIADCCAARPERFAAVCVVDGTSPHQGVDAVDRLAYWVERRGCRGVRLRPRVPGEEPLFGDPSTFPLWQTATRLGIVVSVLMSPKHLPALAGLLERFPDVDVVIDHVGHPDISSGRTTPDIERLLDLERYPRLFIRTSGYYYFTDAPYPYHNCVDLVRRLYDRFGPKRLVWGSDFPHVLLRTGYGRSLRWLERFCPFLDGAQRALVLGKNAERLYWPET